jgi:hypothetical protein
MKRNLSLRLALCGAVALLTHTSFGQTWQTVDDYQGPNASGGAAQAITTDPFGNIYAAGYLFTSDSEGTEAVIRKSSDGGANWTVVDDFSNGELNPGWEYSGIASDAVGTLYAVGDGNWFDNGGWIVRRSQDSGQTWQTVDNPAGTARAVATDSAGNVYVAGPGPTSGWSVRKSADGGNSWATVDAFGTNYARGVFCHPAFGIFTVGYGYITTGTGKKAITQRYSYVRRSGNGGATWTTVDAYLGGVASGIGADVLGNLYVVGNNGSQWTMRKSSNGGASWATVDNFSCITLSTKPLRTQCYYGGAAGLAGDSRGNLFVAGVFGNPGAAYTDQWAVREDPGCTGNWQTVDLVPSPNWSNQSGALGIAIDNGGNVFVAGWEHGGLDWVVKKLPAAP